MHEINSSCLSGFRVYILGLYHSALQLSCLYIHTTNCVTSVMLNSLFQWQREILLSGRPEREEGWGWGRADFLTFELTVFGNSRVGVCTMSSGKGFYLNLNTNVKLP
jgi:hypothetical protein